MKVLFITNNFPPIVDGVGDYTFHLSQEFVKNGHQVFVVCSRKEEIIKNAETINHITVLPVVAEWNKNAIKTILSTASQIQPDWIIPQYVPYSFNYYGVPFWFYNLISSLKKANYKVAITFHEIFIDLELNKPKYIPVALAQRFITHLISNKVDQIFVSIERVRRQLRNYEGKMKRIPIGSNIRPIEISEEEVSKLKKKIAPNGEFVMASFGFRNQLTLVHLLHRLIQDNQNVKLLLPGKMNSNTVEEIKKLSEQLSLTDKIHLTGYLDNNNLFATLRCANAFIMLEENRGGVTTKSSSLAVAYAAGLPVIGTKGHMTDNFFTDRENILFTNSSSQDLMVNDLKNIIQNKDGILDRLREGSKKTYKEFLSWDKVYNSYLKVLN